MTILVTGANGQLGNCMRLLAARGGDRYIFTDVNTADGMETVPLDITDIGAIRRICAEHRVDAIVNCAAYTNVDAAETDSELAERLNADAPANLAEVARERGGLLVHISTDYVFGREPYNIPCREDQRGTPTGVYGLTKLHGEQRIAASGCKHVIIRTAWLYSEFGRNFCKTMMHLTATRPVLSVVFDQAGTPTYAMDLAGAVMTVLDDWRGDMSGETYKNGGIYHYSNEGVCSWYDFTKMIAEYAGNTGCDVLPCHSDEFPSPVKRPSYSVLDKTKIKETFGLRIPYWTDSLKTCIANLKKNQDHV